MKGRSLRTLRPQAADLARRSKTIDTAAPNRLQVLSFTYASSPTEFAYAAHVIDVLSRAASTTSEC